MKDAGHKREGAGGAARLKWPIAVGIAALAPPLLLRCVAGRLRRKPDADAGEVLREPMGERGRYIDSFDGARIYTEELGAGPAIVFAHGWFNSLDMWHFQKKELAEGFHLVFFDQRWHARSDCPEVENITMEALARDLRAVLGRCVPDEPVVLVGHSMGGMSILKYCEMFGEDLGTRVKGVVLVDTAHVPVQEMTALGAAPRWMREPVIEPALRFAVEHPGPCDGIKRAVIGTSLFLVAVRYLGHGSRASLTQMEFIGEIAGQSSVKGACLAGQALFANESGIPLEPLRDSGIPVVIWVGEKDRVICPDISRRMRAELPGSELHVVPDTGHASFMEEYRRFNRVLSEFAERSFAR